MVKRFMSAAVIVTTMLLVTASAFAGTKTHKSAKVSFWLPDEWKVVEEKANLIAVTDKKEEVGLLFMVARAKDMKSVANEIDKVLADTAEDIETQPAENVTINGMDGSLVDATGTVDGKPVGISVLVIKTPAKKFLMVLGMVQSDKLARHEANLERIFQSLKPLRGNKFGS